MFYVLNILISVRLSPKFQSRLLQQSQDLCNHAEQAVSEMEKAAFDQLLEQASNQETLHLKLKEEIGKEQKRIKEYQSLLKVSFYNVP